MINKDVPCKGVYSREYEAFHLDGSQGCTTSRKLWEDGRKSEHNCQLYPSTSCICCTNYSQWKQSHPELAKQLERHANVPVYYKSYPHEQVSVTIDGEDIRYMGTIRALNQSPLGACTEKASSMGKHPYVCNACNALVKGKTSTLRRKLLRDKLLTNPRSETDRATKRGVSHKFCSTEHLQFALQARRSSERVQREKQISLSESNKKLLHDSWHLNPTTKPYVEMLIKVLEENKLSTFDTNFLKNWIGKKAKGRHYHADEQARSLTILYSNKLGEKMYSTTAPILGLPSARQARKIRAKNANCYLPGLNDWAFEKTSKRNKLKPLQNGMDGTRVIRTVELYLDQYLVGEMFPADVRLFPTQLIEATTPQEIQAHVYEVRKNNAYGAEAYSFNLSDTTNEYSDMLVGSFPEAHSGVTGDHIFALMLEVEKYAIRHNLPLIGHCTDSAANALKGLVKLATPSTYMDHCPTHSIKFIGLPLPNFVFYAPFLRSEYPSIAYPCWDHSARTVVRNLMNSNITIVCGELTNSGDGMQCYRTATIHDLRALKNRHAGSIVKHSDINPFIKQNCDATTRILTTKTIEELSTHVPESKGTQLYLRAAVWTHEPYRNERFGPPPKVVRSLWAGLMTWRRWRRYIQITPNLSLTDHFISRSHYITEELLAHAGICHQLTLYHSFPQLPISEYSMRNTGNRGIEAIHGIFRGGSSSLPITSPNLSFREFLCRMNKRFQVHEAEHSLQQIEGNTIIASKKKRVTSAISSGETASEESYIKPSTFDEFIQQLVDATCKGDSDIKSAISELAPEIASTLKSNKDWDSPPIAIDLPEDGVSLVCSAHSSTSASFDHDKLITCILGPLPNSPPASPPNSTSDQLSQADTDEAYANLITDLSPITNPESPVPTNKKTTVVQSLLKGMQPYREKPSKDRSRRFAAGQIPFDKEPAVEHNVKCHDFWAIFPTDKIVKSAKVFLLGQLLYISESGKPVISSMSNNPNTAIVLDMFEYYQETESYTPAGRSALLKATDILLANVTTEITGDADNKYIDHTLFPDLTDYVPFHPQLDLTDRLTEPPTDLEQDDSDDPFIVEKIVEKRYNSKKVQYEYLVKWIGYSSTENTWELLTNIPDTILETYEQSLLSKASTSSNTDVRRSGLRDRATRKATNRPDFIVNV